MSELVEKFLTNADWRKGYDRGRADARREPTYGRLRFCMLASDDWRARKGSDFVSGYETGYDEVRFR